MVRRVDAGFCGPATTTIIPSSIEGQLGFSTDLSLSASSASVSRPAAAAAAAAAALFPPQPSPRQPQHRAAAAARQWVSSSASFSSSLGGGTTSDEAEEPLLSPAVMFTTIPRGGAASSPSPEKEDTKLPKAKAAKQQQQQRERRKQQAHGSKKKKKQSRGEKAAATKTEDDDDDEESATTTSTSSSTLPIVQEILSEYDYYRILGTTKEEMQQLKHHKHFVRQLKKLYRKRAVQTHPDKTNGDRRAFDRVAEAYEVLSDPTQRQRYDRYGKRGVQPNMSEGGASSGSASFTTSAEDLFRSFFGNSSPFGSSTAQRQQQQYRSSNRTARFQLQVTLEDLYFGKTVPVQLPAMSAGSGSGGGKTVQVDIPRGAADGETVTIAGAVDADQTQAPPGDLLLELRQRPHATFARLGRHDLLLQLEISWSEALTGCQRRVRHLDGSTLHLVSAPGAGGSSNTNDDDGAASGAAAPAVIRSGDVHVLPGWGMPRDVHGHDGFGDLYVQYQVVQQPQPQQQVKHNNVLTADERRELRRLLRKLEGKSDHLQQQDWPFEQRQQRRSKHSGKYHRLQRASRSDFERRRAREARQQQQQQQQQQRREAEFGFGGIGGFPGFSPFGAGTGTGGQRFYWSSGAASNPYFGDGGAGEGGNPDLRGADDDGETQCRQM